MFGWSRVRGWWLSGSLNLLRLIYNSRLIWWYIAYTLYSLGNQLLLNRNCFLRWPPWTVIFSIVGQRLSYHKQLLWTFWKELLINAFHLMIVYGICIFTAWNCINRNNQYMGCIFFVFHFFVLKIFGRVVHFPSYFLCSSRTTCSYLC